MPRYVIERVRLWEIVRVGEMCFGSFCVMTEKKGIARSTISKDRHFEEKKVERTTKNDKRTREQNESNKILNTIL